MARPISKQEIYRLCEVYSLLLDIQSVRKIKESITLLCEINDYTINASINKYNHIYISRKLLDKDVFSDLDIISILAHELGHYRLKHLYTTKGDLDLYMKQEFDADLYSMITLVNMKLNPKALLNVIVKYFPNQLERIIIAKSNLAKLESLYSCNT